MYCYALAYGETGKVMAFQRKEVSITVQLFARRFYSWRQRHNLRAVYSMRMYPASACS